MSYIHTYNDWVTQLSDSIGEGINLLSDTEKLLWYNSLMFEAMSGDDALVMEQRRLRSFMLHRKLEHSIAQYYQNKAELASLLYKYDKFATNFNPSELKLHGSYFSGWEGFSVTTIIETALRGFSIADILSTLFPTILIRFTNKTLGLSGFDKDIIVSQMMKQVESTGVRKLETTDVNIHLSEILSAYITILTLKHIGRTKQNIVAFVDAYSSKFGDIVEVLGDIARMSTTYPFLYTLRNEYDVNGFLLKLPNLSEVFSVEQMALLSTIAI